MRCIQKMKKKIILVLFLLAGNSLFALDIYEEIANSIRSGDARQLASYFSNTIDLTVLGKENVYSKAQGELILKDFFGKNPPKSFTILQKGSSPEGAQYAIGNLITASGKTIRTSFYFKSVNGKIIIQEFRLESD